MASKPTPRHHVAYARNRIRRTHRAHSGSQPIVDVTGLEVSFAIGKGRRVHAVNGVDLKLERGETLAILGESGSGRSVTLRALGGGRDSCILRSLIYGAAARLRFRSPKTRFCRSHPHSKRSHTRHYGVRGILKTGITFSANRRRLSREPWPNSRT